MSWSLSRLLGHHSQVPGYSFLSRSRHLRDQKATCAYMHLHVKVQRQKATLGHLWRALQPTLLRGSLPSQVEGCPR